MWTSVYTLLSFLMNTFKFWPRKRGERDIVPKCTLPYGLTLGVDMENTVMMSRISLI